MNKLSELKLFEEQVIQSVTNICIANNALLNAYGLTVKGPDFRVLENEIDNYRSELEITFWSENEFIDVIEFFICYNGRENVKINEVEIYIQTEIDKILQSE